MNWCLSAIHSQTDYSWVTFVGTVVLRVQSVFVMCEHITKELLEEDINWKSWSANALKSNIFMATKCLVI